MSWRRAFTYGAIGSTCSVILTAAVSGTWVPHEWLSDLAGITIINAVILAFAAALIGETK